MLYASLKFKKILTKMCKLESHQHLDVFKVVKRNEFKRNIVTEERKSMVPWLEHPAFKDWKNKGEEAEDNEMNFQRSREETQRMYHFLVRIKKG